MLYDSSCLACPLNGLADDEKLDAFKVYTIALRMARTVARKYELEDMAKDLARMAVAVSAVETGGRFNAKAKNPTSTARGLMQILIGTQKAIEKLLGIKHQPTRIYEPEYAILLGTTYLAYQLKRYGGSVEKAVYAYNMGSYGVKTAAKGHGPAYVKLFKQYWKKLDFDALDEQVYEFVTQMPSLMVYFDPPISQEPSYSA